ncbi:hypothetical protein [Catenuloplanes atrovinosus]|uniref:DUF4034 domain-containing protein n=1 Tax=Catenuloplanes atrovinosus TaxID=137266 RepID=A0AAE3YRL2_9ACTN|nr:hypothetical protein [Catenuloplanes atrovinosus]MDR7277059.1 hypothetical protein [Catenuloplanes atrovinosus]
MLPPLQVIDFDPATPYPEVGVLRQALVRGDWPAVRGLWGRSDHATRSELLASVDPLRDGDTTVIGAALAADPADPVAAVFAARRLIAAAAPVRDPVEHDRLLVRAEALLSATTARHPADVTAWEQRIVVAPPLGLGLDECVRRYARLAALAPHHVPGQLAHLDALCPRDDGGWEPAHAFARERMMAAPPGAHNGVLVAVAHLERFFRQPQWDIRPLRDARERLYEAAHRSVWHPGFRRTAGWAYAVNVFACAFALVSDRAAADGLFATIGPIATRRPWDRFAGHAGPGENFRYLRGAIPR